MKIPLRQYWKLLVNYLKPQKGRVFLLGLLLFSNLGLQLLNPQIVRQFIDRAVAGDGVDKLLPIAGIFIGLALVVQILGVLATYISENVGLTATNALRLDLAKHCLSLDLPFHNEHTPGELIERIEGDITAMAAFFSQFVIQVLGNFLLLIGILIVLWGEDWRIGLALTLFAAFAIFAINKTRDLAVGPMAKESKARAGLFSFIEERLGGTEDIRASGARPHVMGGLHKALREVFRQGRKSGIYLSVIWTISNGLFLASNLLVFGVGAWLFSSGAVTLGTVYLVYQYTDMLRSPLEQMSRQIQDLQKAGAGISRVQELYFTQPQISDGPGKPIPSGALSVEFDEVSFSYNELDNVLKELNFRLEPGKVLGLLGRTGSGKTSTTRLLFRLYDVSAGAIRLGGVDIREAKLADLRQRVAMVTQEVQIFHASVRDNLTLFNPAIKNARILEVIYELGLGDWFDRLPNGLDTELKSHGTGLSAGEAQLLAFARVFLEEPGLVIMDEASSRLDPATERKLEEAVDKLLENRTGIIIAHRLATVQRADDIIILENGRVLEYGPRAELARDPDSRFYQLLQTGLEEALA